jgi:AraC family transcriptional activator of pyochelin receptor
MKTHDFIILQKAYHFLADHTDQKVRIAELAIHLGMSRTQLKKGFRELYGISIHQFHLNKRLEKGYQLLIETGQEIGTIALQTGFKSQSSFTVAFKNKTGGITPSDIRKLMQDHSR